MSKAGGRGERESSLASGWTVRSEPSAVETDEWAARAASEAGAEAADGAAYEAVDLSKTDVDSDEPTQQLSNTMLVVLGLLGGLYLLYAWLWLSWVQFYAPTNAALAESSGALGSVLQQTLFWFTPVASILWFAATLALHRGKQPGEGLRTRGTVIWLVIGAVVLFPTPVLSGIGGA